jgi:hypothetical protein
LTGGVVGVFIRRVDVTLSEHWRRARGARGSHKGGVLDAPSRTASIWIAMLGIGIIPSACHVVDDSIGIDSDTRLTTRLDGRPTQGEKM